MIARLGNVIYWLSCGVAALLFVGACIILAVNEKALYEPPLFFLALSAVGAWLFGRACLYILAAR